MQPPANQLENAIPSTGEIPRFRVLLVDDDIALLRVLSTTIKRFFGDRILQISQHTNGHAGLDEALSHPFDIALLDLTLPDIHGLELLRIFKSNPRTRDMCVVILSGSMDREDIDQSFALDAEDYILKPFEPIRLNTRIQSIMRMRKALNDLQSTQSRLTNILDSLGAVVWSFCPREKRLIYCGGAPMEVYGLSSEKLLENP